MSDFDLVIRGGTVVNAAEISKCEVGIKEGRIVALGERLGPGKQEIDATGNLLCRAGSIAIVILISDRAVEAEMQRHF